MSFWLDLRILFETVKIVCAGFVSANAELGPPERRPDARLRRVA